MTKQEFLHMVQTTENAAQSFVDRIKRTKEAFYLYGAGYPLAFAVSFMKQHELEPVAILDSYKEGTYDGIPIIRYQDFLEANPDKDVLFVISAPSYRDEIRKVLCEQFSNENIFSFEMEWYANYLLDIEEYRKYLLQNRDMLLAFEDDLSDEKSKKTFELTMKGRLSAEIDYLTACYEPNQYYPEDIVHFEENEVIVEAGSNDGKTLIEFVEKCPSFRSAYCFEPDEKCVQILKKLCCSLDECGEKIHIIPKGVWDTKTTLKFYLEGNEILGNGKVVEQTSENILEIPVTLIDEEVCEPITYIKMDIEGSELKALQGAKKQIVHNKPKLAICVYHKITDYIDIWQYLKKLNPEYKFYLRHHSQNSASETVLYAITK